jgi:hypothetical protein
MKKYQINQDLINREDDQSYFNFSGFKLMKLNESAYELVNLFTDAKSAEDAYTFIDESSFSLEEFNAFLDECLKTKILCIIAGK